MTVITVEVLEEAKAKIDSGFNHISETIEGGLEVTPEAIDWLKENHFQLKVAESFGPTGIAVLIYPAI